ncbi:MAG: hypothetical protein IPM64_14605 [Phycisphaerales bacterium]|nr:hypothetical protein [Phycisphaerales bacterium]
MSVTDATGRSGTLLIPRSAAVYDGIAQTLQYTLPAPAAIIDVFSGGVIATVTSATVYARMYPPRINLDIVIEAGAYESYLSVAGPWVGFPVISADVGQMHAYAGFTVRDLNWDGARLASLGQPGSGAFRAMVDGLAPDGFQLTQLVNQLIVSADGTVSGWQNDPARGTRSIFTAARDASVLMAFSLTAGDRATCSGRLSLFGREFPKGDSNCDTRINGFDIDAFVTAMLTPEVFAALYPHCETDTSDCNADGIVNNFDVDPFLSLSSGAGPAFPNTAP